MGFGSTQGFTPKAVQPWTTVTTSLGAKAGPPTAPISTSVSTSVA